MLLVHDDQAQRIDRRKNGGSRPDDNAGAALADFVPFVMAFPGGQMAVQDGHQRLQRAGTEAALNRSTVCGVNDISGTSTIAPLPCRRLRAMACK